MTITYQPFADYLEDYEEHPEHKQPRAVVQARLEICDTCTHHEELRCLACKGCGGRSLMRWATRPTTDCPKGKWPENTMSQG